MSVPRYWREQIPRYRLQGQKCKSCGTIYFPSKPICKCGNKEFEKYKMPETGKIITWTIINNPPVGFEKYKPYIVGLIELDDGNRILSQIVDIDFKDLFKDLRVEATFRRITEDGKTGIIQYGYKFRPIIE